jgi:hypothetical protein
MLKKLPGDCDDKQATVYFLVVKRMQVKHEDAEDSVKL